MRPSRAQSSGAAASCHMLYSAAYITITFESEFLVHTTLIAPARWCSAIEQIEVSIDCA
jgi:hypothetical protein